MTTTNIVADTIEDGIQSIPRRISLCCKPYVGPTISKYIGKIDIDAPFTLTFAFLCLIVQNITYFNWTEIYNKLF